MWFPAIKSDSIPLLIGGELISGTPYSHNRGLFFKLSLAQWCSQQPAVQGTAAQLQSVQNWSYTVLIHQKFGNSTYLVIKSLYTYRKIHIFQFCQVGHFCKEMQHYPVLQAAVLISELQTDQCDLCPTDRCLFLQHASVSKHLNGQITLLLKFLDILDQMV